MKLVIGFLLSWWVFWSVQGFLSQTALPGEEVIIIDKYAAWNRVYKR